MKITHNGLEYNLDIGLAISKGAATPVTTPVKIGQCFKNPSGSTWISLLPLAYGSENMAQIGGNCDNWLKLWSDKPQTLEYWATYIANNRYVFVGNLALTPAK